MPALVLPPNSHPTDDLLEEYIFGRVPEPTLSFLEEHLLICPNCQCSLEATSDFVTLMKTGAAEFKTAPRRSTGRGLWRLVAEPRGRWYAGIAMAAMVLLTLGGITEWRSRVPLPPTSVVLTAMRGDPTEGVAHAPSGQPMDLVVDQSRLPSSEAIAYLLEIADTEGKSVWRGTASASETKLTARIPHGLAAGVYWVRLSTVPGDLLREYALRID